MATANTSRPRPTIPYSLLAVLVGLQAVGLGLVFGVGGGVASLAVGGAGTTLVLAGGGVYVGRRIGGRRLAGEP